MCQQLRTLAVVAAAWLLTAGTAPAQVASPGGLNPYAYYNPNLDAMPAVGSYYYPVSPYVVQGSFYNPYDGPYVPRSTVVRPYSFFSPYAARYTRGWGGSYWGGRSRWMGYRRYP
jgi:hypothetical protein